MANRLIWVIIFFYCGLSFFNPAYIEEDAFIVFKVAENLANGYGYVFNKGERIEVCSTLTWLYLLAFFRWL
jgi:arabinofuranosyltransferase